jgi:hypothetical protein
VPVNHVNIIAINVPKHMIMANDISTIRVPRTPRCQPRRRIQLSLRRRNGAPVIKLNAADESHRQRYTRANYGENDSVRMRTQPDQQNNNENEQAATHRYQLESAFANLTCARDWLWCVHSLNAEHQRWEPAAADAGIGSELNGWLPSAECSGSATRSCESSQMPNPRNKQVSDEDDRQVTKPN